MDSRKISFSEKFAQVPPPPPPWLVNGVFNTVLFCRPSALLGFASGPQRLSKSSCPRGGFDTETLTFFHPRAVRPFFFPLIYSFRLTDYQCFLAESGNKSSSCYWSGHTSDQWNQWGTIRNWCILWTFGKQPGLERFFAFPFAQATCANQ